MCLVLFSYQPESHYPLVVAANRDELYARAARSAHYWADAPELLAGRDLSAGGTWLGVTRNGRFAAVTNFAEEGGLAEEGGEDGLTSRGTIPHAFLTGTMSAHDFARHIEGPRYRGFNLLAWDGANLVYASNRGAMRKLQPGIYGLSNAELGAAWPKVVSGVGALREELASGPSLDGLLAVLADETMPPDHELPSRGRPLDLERRVAPRFINGEEYGTRASTAVIIGRANIQFTEQPFAPGARAGPRQNFEIELPSV
jgi:uncharacterized protein with NRDE domain